MTSQNDSNEHHKRSLETLEEICENTRAIRRVVNRILDHMHEYGSRNNGKYDEDYDPDAISWKDLDNSDDMYM
jgi:hypothetical protein